MKRYDMSPAGGASAGRGPLQVRLDAGGQPAGLFWQGRWQRVARVLETWHDTGQWWDGEEEKVFYRVMLASGAVWEIYRPGTEDASWHLYRIYD